MLLDDLGNVGEFLGSIAVVVSLLYLAVQIRQNTRSVRAAVYQEFTRESSQLAYLLVTDELAGRAFMVGLPTPGEVERIRI